MAKFAQLPDGRQIKVPDDATVEEITGLVNQLGAAPPPQGSLDRFGRVTRDAFPLFGMMTGGAAGAIKGASLGSVAGPPGAILGGTLGGLAGGIAGGGGGSLVKQGLDYLAGQDVTPEGALSNILEDTKSAAYGELVPPLAFAGGRAALQSPQVQYVAQKAAEWFPTGKALLNYYASNTYKKLLDARSKVLGDLVGKDIGPGQSITEIGPATKRALETEYKEGYKAAKDIIKEEVVPVPSFRKSLESAAQDPRIMRDEKASKWVEKHLTLSENGTMTGSEIDAAQSKINSMLYPKSPETAEQVWSKGLLPDLMAADVAAGRAGEGSGEAYLKARNSYKNKMAFDSTYSVFRRATRINNDLSESFNPGLAKLELDRQHNNIIRQYGKERGQVVIDEASDFIRTMGDAVKEMKTHPPVTSGELLGFGGGTAAAMGYLGIPKEWVPVPYGFSLFAAHSIGSSKGWLRAAKVGKLPPTPAGLKLGARMGVFKAMEQDPADAPPGAIPWK